MTDSPPDLSDSHGFALGPAVSPRRSAGSFAFASLVEPLGPFSSAAAEQPAAAVPAETHPGEEGEPVPMAALVHEEAPEEEPLLLLDDVVQPEDAAAWAAWDAAAEEGAHEPEVPAEVFSPEPAFPEPVTPVVPQDEALQEAADILDGLGAEAAAAPAELVEATEEADSGSGAAPAAAPREAAPALLDVAARLERIASSLRGRTPGELLADSSDPLEVLIAGYALGFAQARRSPGDSTGSPEP